MLDRSATPLNGAKESLGDRVRAVWHGIVADKRDPEQSEETPVSGAPEVSPEPIQADTRTDAAQLLELLPDIRQRLVHIEQKTDGAIRRLDAQIAFGAGLQPNPDQLYGNLTYAQCGEDLIVITLFHALGIHHPTYMDIGAHHPFNISNTALLYQRGSRGINVEVNPNLIQAFRQHRPEDVNLNVGVGPTSGTLDFHFIDDWSGRNTFSRESAEALVRENPQFSIQRVLPLPVLTLTDIITHHARGQFPDFLSLDVEGVDFEVVRTTPFGADRPLVLCVESPADYGLEPVREWLELLRPRGYRLYVRTYGNLIFIHHSIAGQLGLD